jgi:Ca-activated chloride channel homolog
VQLIHAGGYPIKVIGKSAIIHPGDMLSGQHRKLFLTFKVPTTEERHFDLAAFSLHFKNNGVAHSAVSNHDFKLACVADKTAVMASIDQDAWADQVVKEDYNQLKEEVATAIRNGQKDDALVRIQEYEARNRAVNANVKSATVSDNLEKDVLKLRESVEETFSGAPAAVAEKKKQHSKALQYESYQIRRDKK